MERKTINLRNGVLALFILVAAFSRVIPHIPNFSPLGAMSLFGAAYFSKKWQAFILPFFATWLSDLFINNVIYASYYPTFTWFYQGWYWQYASYLILTFIGLNLFNKVNTNRVIIGAISATIVFYLITNFGVWASGTMYPMTLNGLLTCYAAGIPFIKGTLLGDLFYSGALFALFAFAQKQFPILRTQQY